jgi:soluble lytic murein transglycosylase
MRLLRRRAELRLWQEQSDPATVLRFVDGQPASALGRFALARAFLSTGDREAAEREVRKSWRSDELSEVSEARALDVFHDVVTREDHRARMDKRIGAKDLSGAMRAARRLGNADKALDLLDAVATEARQDLGYVLCRIHWSIRHDRIAEATRLTLSARSEGMALQDTDEWWRERRVLARKLLDLGEMQNAYQVVRDAAAPANENYRAEYHFVPGWIALRYLNDAATARKHFAHIDDGSSNPIVLARANYWRARAAEALGDQDEMRADYEAAARHQTAYYGQLARAKLGHNKVELRSAFELSPDQRTNANELVHAVEILYTLGERDLAMNFLKDLAEESGDAAALVHRQFGPEVERSVVYSVARTESAFDQRDTSPAKAVGLMQVTPEAGRDTAKRFGVTYDWNRLVSDPVYNTQMGAAELGALLREYKGSYIMSFAAYNAGRGRVQQWVKQHGDPRSPNVDAIDWVERIPFAETRNYVQRVMENLQVYRTRFESSAPLISELDDRLPLVLDAKSESRPPVSSIAAQH